MNLSGKGIGMAPVLERHLEAHNPSAAEACGLPAITQDRWQYRLTRRPHPGAIGIGDFWLSVGQDLPIAIVLDQQGRQLGSLLGFPIDLDRKTLVTGDWHVPAEIDPATEDGIHRILRALGGQYIWICLTPAFARIYPDAITQVTCVWDESTQSAGATATAILTDDAYAERFDEALFTRLGVIGEGWFPAGLTAHHGVNRLLPNHFLDLDTWTAHRMSVVPAADAALTPDAAVSMIVAIMQSQISALRAGSKRLVVALTAGRDCRAVLACVRPWADHIQAVTVTGEDRHQVDSIVAQQIAESVGISHLCLPRQIADQIAQDLFLRRSGHCFGDSNMKYHTSIAPLIGNCVFIGGLGGEVARAVFWRDGDTADMPISPALVMGRLGLPRAPKAEASIKAWLDRLPAGITAQAVWDLVYLELRQGPWGTAQFCADPTLVRHAPLITYDTVSLMLALPDDWKKDSKLSAAIVANQWPELAQFRYNTAGRLQDIRAGVRRVIDDPSLILKKLRKRFA